jgi:branched-chain amino acid aminotransferase
LLLMDLPHTPEGLTKITKKLIQTEEYKEDVYVRPLIYKADEMIGVRLHGLKDEISIVALPFGKYVSNDTDAHVTFSSWTRLDDNMIPARGKLTGAYVNTALIKSDALMSGFDEAIVLNADGHLSEGSAENIFIIKNGILVTPSVTDNILEGITRATVMQLAKDELGMEVVERSIDRTEVYLCEELFLTGTAAQVTAVTKINHRKIGDGVMGEVTAKLKQMYDDLVRGKIAKYKGWNYPVY